MKKVTAAAAAWGVGVALMVGLAPSAHAGTADVGSAQDTVNRLDEDGYRVIVNKVGDAPLNDCSVTAIRPGREITQRVTDSGGDSIDAVQYTTVYADVQC